MITTRMSSKGQIAIPKRIREQLGLERGVELAIAVRGDEVRLRKVKSSSWRRWRGVLKGTGALQEHEREHRMELKRDAQNP